MEIKGLNQTKNRYVTATQSTAIKKSIKFLCPILLDDERILETIKQFVFEKTHSQEELLGIIIRSYDHLQFENLENLIITLDGYQIISQENGFKSDTELDDYFIHQERQIEISDDKKQIKIDYRNECNT